MRAARMWIALVPLLLIAASRAPEAGSQRAPAETRIARLPPSGGPARANPFGLLLGARALDARARADLARRLGARYWRPVDASPADRPAQPCPECDAARDAGLRLVLTVRANGGGVLNPTIPPADLAAFSRGLEQLLDRYHPVLLAVENEENSDLFYRGSPAEYLKELQAACTVSHRRGIPCTNGGLVSALVAALVADHYRQSGDSARADAYLRRTVGDRAVMLRSARGTAQVSRGKALLAGYHDAGADYVNFHWYVRDPATLAEAVSFLRSTTSLEPISNEVGQTGTDDADGVTELMQAILDARLPLAIWFSVDTAPGRARALTDPQGVPRPTGIAFQRVASALARD